MTENEAAARATALRRREDTQEADAATPMDNPLDMLVSQRGHSSWKSKVLSNGDPHLLTTDGPGITSGSRFVVEHTSHPTEPDGDNDCSPKMIMDRSNPLLDKGYSKNTSATRRMS
jgi:hypothetical protein